MAVYSDNFIKVCKHFESLHLKAYICPAGVPTAGWGSTYHYDKQRKIKLGDTLTESQAERFLLLEVDTIAENAERIPAWESMNQGQRDALLDFMYNLGPYFYQDNVKFKTINYCLNNYTNPISPLQSLYGLSSDLLKRAGLDPLGSYKRMLGQDLVPYAFLLYRNPGSAFENGLIRRRIAEINLWLGKDPFLKNSDPEKMNITAITETFLKKEPIQSTELEDDQLVDVELGKTYSVAKVISKVGDHYQIELDYGAGTWYVYGPHWGEWAKIEDTKPEEEIVEFPKYEDVNWNDMSQKLGPYFTVGEYVKQDRRRIPQSESTKRNSYKIMKELHDVRKAWGKPIRITSGHRPLRINQAVGGVSNSRHVAGDAVDIADANGNTVALEAWLDQRWFGALGYGSRYRGFVHLDCRNGKGLNDSGAKGPRWKY